MTQEQVRTGKQPNSGNPSGKSRKGKRTSPATGGLLGVVVGGLAAAGDIVRFSGETVRSFGDVRKYTSEVFH